MAKIFLQLYFLYNTWLMYLFLRGSICGRASMMMVHSNVWYIKRKNHQCWFSLNYKRKIFIVNSPPSTSFFWQNNVELLLHTYFQTYAAHVFHLSIRYILYSFIISSLGEFNVALFSLPLLLPLHECTFRKKMIH